MKSTSTKKKPQLAAVPATEERPAATVNVPLRALAEAIAPYCDAGPAHPATALDVADTVLLHIGDELHTVVMAIDCEQGRPSWNFIRDVVARAAARAQGASEIVRAIHCAERKAVSQ